MAFRRSTLNFNTVFFSLACACTRGILIRARAHNARARA
jgi:hypothetical protein